jgi:RimJ/RimL family protein N-acetyltransferase
MSLCLRGVRAQDSDLLLRWRNDPETRQSSINTGKVSSQEHARWFDRIITLGQQQIAIAELDGLAVGVVRLEWNDSHDTCEISFTVAPEHRRRGLGLRIVQQRTEGLKDFRVLARVKVANLASQRIFSRLGFRVVHRTGELVLYAKDPAGAITEAISPFQLTEASVPPISL